VALLHQQDDCAGPKTLGNATPAAVVVPPVVGGPWQGWPANGFVPVDRLWTLGAGETGASRPAATVFPLITGFTVFPLSSGLLVFCASAIVVVALRTRTLRPISAMRFTAMSDLLVVAPDTNRNTSDFLDCPEDKRRRLKLLTKDEARRIAANVACRGCYVAFFFEQAVRSIQDQQKQIRGQHNGRHARHRKH